MNQALHDPLSIRLKGEHRTVDLARCAAGLLRPIRLEPAKLHASLASKVPEQATDEQCAIRLQPEKIHRPAEAASRNKSRIESAIGKTRAS